jgi:hypothetical protein
MATRKVDWISNLWKALAHDLSIRRSQVAGCRLQVDFQPGICDL